MKSLGEYIKEKREEAELSLREASKLSGVSHTHIRDIERGSSVPSFEMVIKFLKTYSVNIEEFLTETGLMPPEVKRSLSDEIKCVPVLSWTQAGSWREMVNPNGYEAVVETDSKGTFALTVRGDSMEPEFYEGDILIINPYLKQEHNDYVVVSNDEWEATFKQLKKYGKTRVLHPLNSRYEDIELDKNSEYRMIGVVVEKKKKYK